MSDQTDNRLRIEGPDHQQFASGTVIDPVCGMEISREDAVGSYVHKGQEYFFCNPSCLENFRANPSQYLSPGQAVAASGVRPSRAGLLRMTTRPTSGGECPILYLPHGS